MRIAVITNGISEDYEKACKVMKDTEIGYADIQNVFNKPVEKITMNEAEKIKKYSLEYGITPSSITSHAFAGIPVKSIEVNDSKYTEQLLLLKNAIKVAKFLGVKQVRSMVFSKEIVTFGSNGADKWNSGGNKSWPKFLKLYEPVIKLAEDEGVDLCFENGFNGMISSTYLAKKMINDLGSPEHLKFIWDPGNALYYGEKPTVEVYEQIKKHLANIHIKDLKIDTIKSEVEARPIGSGQIAPYLLDLATALRKDDYKGFVTLENFYRPEGKDFVDGYHTDIPQMKKIFMN